VGRGPRHVRGVLVYVKSSRLMLLVLTCARLLVLQEQFGSRYMDILANQPGWRNRGHRDQGIYSFGRSHY
jgi:hypothetical protein